MKITALVSLLFISIVATAQPIEEMEFNIRFGFIRGGKANLVTSKTTFENKPAIRYYLEAKTVGLPEKLFPVYDIYDSYVNPKSLLPYMAIRDVREQNYKSYEKTFFYHNNDSIYSEKSGGRKVPKDLVDFLTVFFYMRQNHLLEKLDHGEEFEVPVYHAGEDFMMQIKYLGTEKIRTNIGNITCHVITPTVNQGKALKRSDGLKFYFSKDANKVPILLEFDMKVGSLKCELKTYKKEGLKLILH